MSHDQALGPTYVRDALLRLEKHAALVIDAGSAEDVHQMRVAVRRLRVALTLFKRALPDARDTLKRDLRWLFRALGALRDLQMFAAACNDRVQEGTPGMAALERRIMGHVAREKITLASLLGGARYRRLLTRVAALAAAPELDHKKRWFARRLKKRQARVIDGLEAAVADRKQQHEARKALKTLRYTAELAAPAYGKADVKRYVKELKRLQDELGAAVDLHAWEALARAECTNRGLRERLLQMFADEHEAHAARVEKRVKAFIACDGFWA